jgi:hypothetical protein
MRAATRERMISIMAELGLAGGLSAVGLRNRAGVRNWTLAGENDHPL